jgi:hypothetical protein
MKAEAAKLHHDLQRYWYLLSQINDQQTSKVLREHIAEAEARLDAIDSARRT